MINNKNNTFKITGYLFLVLLGISYLLMYLFRNWSLNKSLYFNLFWSIHFCLFIGVIVFFIIHKIQILKPLCIVLMLAIWSIIFYFQFNPIDTYTYPDDIKTLSEKDSKKVVVREYKNAVTNRKIIDTVTVIDKFIFRQVLIK
jgi:hypothetical protein